MLTTLLYAGALMAAQGPHDRPWMIAKQPVETRVRKLLAQMSLDEKLAQLTQTVDFGNNNPNNLERPGSGLKLKGVGSMIVFKPDRRRADMLQRQAIQETRLGIPILFGADIIHGARSVYPTPLALAASFDTDLVSQMCGIAARESRAGGVRWTFAPMIDVSRDARWGRMVESAGEDVLLNARLAEASVKGFQGSSLEAPTSLLACLKHFVGYGASESGRDYAYTEISDQTMEETYLPPYQAGVKAGALTVMSGFNDINGVPATANKKLLTGVLRERWGFGGFVVSDWNGVAQLRDQRLTRDDEDSAVRALLAGVDLDMLDGVYWGHLGKALQERRVTMKDVDRAVERILTVKFKIGLFEHPYVGENVPEPLPDETTRQACRSAAERTFVLLKNEGSLLPINPMSGKRIALVGPLADDRENMLGSWSAWGRQEDVVSIKEGIAKTYGSALTGCIKGCSVTGQDLDLDGVRSVVESADVVLLALGEPGEMTGENASRSNLFLPGRQAELARFVLGLGKPVVLLLSSGRPLCLEDLADRCRSIIEIWHPGIEAGNAVAETLCGKVSPSGRLPVTWPKSVGQIPLYYSKRLGGRPTLGTYLDGPSEPQYEFGHGLGYATMSYSKVRLSKSIVGPSAKLEASVDITNKGESPSEETVLWFIKQESGSVSRPQRLLKHFQKRFIGPRETTTVTWVIDPKRDLAYPGPDGKAILDPAQYGVRAGNGEWVELTLEGRR